MIHQVKVSFQLLQNGDTASASEDVTNHRNPYNKLASFISDLNNHAENYCVIVQVTKAQSFPDNTVITKQLDALIRQLTKRELEIFNLSISGLRNKLIAEKLFIAVETVKRHRKNIVSKAGVSSMEEIKTWLLKTNADHLFG